MTKQQFFDKIDGMTAEAIAKEILSGTATFAEVSTYARDNDIVSFTPAKRKNVRAIIDGGGGGETPTAYTGQPKKVMTEDELNSILKDTSAFRLYTLKDECTKLGYDGDDVLKKCCERLGISYDFVSSANEPLKLGRVAIPKNLEDIPAGYTDIFFWGMPSSGKSCALAAILSTINQVYEWEAPAIPKQFGARYRDWLMYLFDDEGLAHLPGITEVATTHYMPLRVKHRHEAHTNYRNVSFFELSGEIFKYIEEVINDGGDDGNIGSKEERATFEILDLMLNSRNPKVHFFFIDYSAKGSVVAQQAKHLTAAATYFNNYNDIFRMKTDAVYIVLSKADGIDATGDKDRSEKAAKFLETKYGAFIHAVRSKCEMHFIRNFSMKLFSIGDVYFNEICKINRKYSRNIVDELLRTIPPAGAARLV